MVHAPPEQAIEPLTVDAANAYRTFLSVEPNCDVIERTVEQFGSWLREKHWDPPLDVSDFHSDQGRALLVLHHESSEGAQFRARFTEPSPQGTWMTELTVLDPRGGGLPWIALKVLNSEGRWVAVPRLAGYLLQSMDARDGEAPLTEQPRIVDDRGVEDLMVAICDEKRQGLLLVVGTSEDRYDELVGSRRVDDWTRETRGLAEAVILTPAATRELRTGLGASHGTAPGMLRNYYPAADPAVEADSLRHKFLSDRKLGTEPVPAIQKLLGRIARRHAATRAAPDAYRRIDRALHRAENRLLVASAQESRGDDATESLPAEVPAQKPRHRLHEFRADSKWKARVRELESTLAMVQRELRLEEITPEALRRVGRSVTQGGATSSATLSRLTEQLESREATIDELQQEIDFYRELNDDEQLDSAIAMMNAADLADENRWLRLRLASLEDFDAAYGVVPQDAYTNYPSDFSELVQRMPDLREAGVLFTGDKEAAVDLDEHDTLNKIVRVAWEALLVCADYIRARNGEDFDSDLKRYLEKTPPGYRTMSPKKFAESETRGTMQRWGAERQFAVPRSVDEAGVAVMKAHFKLGRVGMVSPRMYILDNHSKDGHIYIGYIGTHLTNSQTN